MASCRMVCGQSVAPAVAAPARAAASPVSRQIVARKPAAAACVGSRAIRGASLVSARTQVSSSSNSRRVTVMKAEGIAGGYAGALLESAQAAGSLEDVYRDVQFIEGLLKTNAEFKTFVENPTAPDEDKKKVFASIAAQAGLKPITVNFFGLLVDKKRAVQLELIASAFDEAYCELTNTQIAIVTSAIELETAEQGLIAQKLQSMTGAKNIKLKTQVDESLLAGFVVQYGPDLSSFIDMSVKGQLAQLERDLYEDAKLVKA